MIPAGFVLSALLACHAHPPSPAHTATLIYTDHWDGEIEPCG